MQNRIGPAFSINRRTARFPESHLFVKPHGLPVLFVDIHTPATEPLDSVTHQSFPDSPSTVIRPDEQHLDIPIACPQKSPYDPGSIPRGRQPYNPEINRELRSVKFHVAGL